jgi:hypothetical protein
MFSSWNDAEVALARHRLIVRFDGKDELSQDVDYYESDPAHVGVGANPGLGPDVSDPLFAGRIEEVSRLAFSRDDAFGLLRGPAQAVSLSIRFPKGRAEGAEPILSTAVGSSGALVSVSYLPGSRMRFNVAQNGATNIATRPVQLETDATHVVSIGFRTVAPGDSGSAAPGTAVALAFDGNVVLSEPWPTRASLGSQAAFGVNTAVDDPGVAGMFSGTILSVEPGSTQGLGLDRGGHWDGIWGPVAMRVRFPALAGSASEPLVTTGTSGAGDFVYVTSAGPNKFRFGFDHWGFGGFVGEPVAVVPGSLHRVEIRMDSLYMPGTRPALESNTVAVLFDGRPVLSGRSVCHPTTAGGIRIGENPIGGSTCGAAFTGEITDVIRSDSADTRGKP